MYFTAFFIFCACFNDEITIKRKMRVINQCYKHLFSSQLYLLPFVVDAYVISATRGLSIKAIKTKDVDDNVK